APTADAEPVNMIENEARKGGPHNAGNRQASHEKGYGLGAFALAEPVGQVKDHTREKARLRQPQQESHRVDLRGVLDEAGARGDDSPTHQNPRDPRARTPLVKEHVAGHSKQEIAEKENAGKQTKLLGADAQLLVHGQGREADIHAVQKRDDIQQKNEGENARLDFADGGARSVRRA